MYATEECTCERDHKEKFICDFCFDEFKSEFEWLMNSVVDENGERFRDETEMLCVKARRSVRDIQKYLKSLMNKGLISHERVDEMNANLNEINFLLFWTDMLDRGV